MASKKSTEKKSGPKSNSARSTSANKRRAPGKKSARHAHVHLEVVEKVTADQDSTAKALLLPDGLVDLRSIDSGGTPIGPKDKSEAKAAMVEIGAELAVLQEKLVAQAIRGGRRRILLILQGMDTSGKDGVVKHVLGLVNPAGVHLTSFKKPTAEETDARLPLAHREAGAAVRNHRRVQPVAVRGRAVVRVHDLVAEGGVVEALRQRSTRSSGGWCDRARRWSSASCTSPATRSGNGCSPGWTIRPNTGSTTRATSTSASYWATTRPPTPTRCGAVHGGCAVVRHPCGSQVVPELGDRRAVDWRRCASSTRSTHRRTSTSNTSDSGSPSPDADP